MNNGALKSTTFGVRVGWSAKFDYPIKWGAGNLLTLQQARDFIQSLPHSERTLPAWQAASEALLQAAQHGGLCLELARIEMMHALLGPKPIAQSSRSTERTGGR
jgi:hypothetical protein